MTHISKWQKREDLKSNIQYCINLLNESYSLTNSHEVLEEIEKSIKILQLIKLQ